MIGRLQMAASAGAGALVAGLLVYVWASVWLVPAARLEGAEKKVGEIAADAQRQENERKKDDAYLQDRSDYDLCAEYLSARGLPVDECERLRGVPEK
ncbi:hypothetical protein MOV76_35750 [Rhizobium sp. PRIMUS64]|uniref:hypothetical protein n=1 Tax=Rhizobium sp. PRIMUS64 TaxID=2908925 RepID=UPI001FF1EC95|nr:hypothetical protein [Rhizobium sp. PRIMUS64]MCJ9696920.1 hypothetical protein [Rhizobium sp. PRIMUS64]